VTAMPLARGARKVIPGRPVCPECNQPMAVDSGKRFACQRCGMVSYRGKFQAGTPKRRVENRADWQVKNNTWYRCVNAPDIEYNNTIEPNFFQPGRDYLPAVVREQWRHCPKGTAFINPQGERVEV
jgi:ribosomal protein S27AE